LPVINPQFPPLIMKHWACTALLLCLIAVPAWAQQLDLRVQLSAVKGDSVPSATLQLYKLPDTVLLATRMYREGMPGFPVERLSKYLLKVSATGYATWEQPVAVIDKPSVIPVTLKRSVKQLDEVVVVSRKPLMKQEDDKTIVEAEALANTSTNAYEVLEKTPGAIVDQDGNVYLSSMTPATIQINGRDVKLSAADLASLLKSLPAGSVQKIEILRNPSAKYDAASSGGIVNLVLKKGIKIGASGSMNVGYFQGVHNTKFAGFNLNKSTKQFSSYLSFQHTDRNNFEQINTQRVLNSSGAYLSQRSRTTFPGMNNYLSLGTDFTVNKKLNIAYDLRVSTNDNRSNARNDIDIFSATAVPLGSNASAIRNHNNALYIGNNLNAKYRFDSAGSELNVQLDYNRYHYSNEQLYNNYYYLPGIPTLFGNGDNLNRKQIFTFQADFTWKLKKGYTLEAGIKTVRSNSRNSAEYFTQQGAGGRKLDSFQTNTFRYGETISSAYLQVSRKFWGLTVKPGVRLETTNISGRQLIPADTSLAIRRTDVFPYLFLRHRLVKLFGFELSGNGIIRRTISRPYYEVLNPYPRYVDQYLFDVGNPSLQPQFTTNYEFNITADDFTIFSWGMNNTSNIFSNVTYQDDQTGIAYRTWDNLGTNREVYLRFVGGIPPGGKYFFYAGAQQNINTYKGFYQGQPLNFSRSSWVFFMYHQYRVSPTLTASVNGFMRTRGLQNFFELENFGGLYLSLNKSLMKKTANLIFSFNDVFLTNQTRFRLQQGNVLVTGNRLGDTRRLGLTFRYNFGLKPREEKKSLFEQPAESREP
jgi:iron complex outermembrane recepter protein